MRSIISIADLTNDEIEAIFELADREQSLRRDRPQAGKIMATLFYEPSTRTRLSFEAAMQRLGGTVISCPDMRASSAAKGETLADTARVVSSYCDVMVVRHPWDGAALAMAENATVPVLNAGDGSHEHPTQTLCDLYTLKKEKGQLRGLNVVVCGDLRNGRTIHSLVYGLARFGANIITLAAGGMELPAFVLERLEQEFGYGVAPVARDDLSAVVTETDAFYLSPRQPHQLALMTEMDRALQNRLATMVSGLRYDAFYMTRKQKERMKEGAGEWSYPTLGAEFLKQERFKDTVVMHPLPRIDELSPALDRDHRGIYFKQAAHGVPVRMALLQFLLANEPARARRAVGPIYQSPEPLAPQCTNPSCVTRREPGSTQPRFELAATGFPGALILRCCYCDHQFKAQLVGRVGAKKYLEVDPAFAPSLREWLADKELVIFASIKQAEELGYEPYFTGGERRLMDAGEIEAAVDRMSREILRDCEEPERLLILGVRSAGAALARRIAKRLEQHQGRKFELGEIDVYGSSEEIRRVAPADPELGPLNLRDRIVVLVDDVMQTGRTVNSALNRIFRAGRPRAVRLAILIDRGHRQVPLKPNYVGKNIPSSARDRVRVRLRDGDDGEPDSAVIYSISGPAGGRASAERPTGAAEAAWIGEEKNR